MTEGKPTPKLGPSDHLVERRAEKIANARSVTVGLAVTFVLMAAGGAVVIRIVDKKDFTSLGLAIWWALQTFTTVGYGDIVPTTSVGRLIGGVEMVLGVSFLTFLTAAVTSTVIQRAGADADAADRAARKRDTQTIVDSLTETRKAISEIDKRLARMEAGEGAG